MIDAGALRRPLSSRKRFGTVDNINTRLDEVTGAITLFSLKTIRDEDDIVDDSLEISLDEAQTIRPDVTLGSVIEVQHDIDDFGRIAAQTAKTRVIIQKVREAERDMVYRDFKDRQGELVNGLVARLEREGERGCRFGENRRVVATREQSFREAFKRVIASAPILLR